MAAKTSSTDILMAAFPGRVSLTPKEIARAIHGEGKDTKKRVEAVRVALDEGRLVPGLRKTGARWNVPIAKLGAALDAQVRPVAHDIGGPAPRRSKHSTIGPRMLLAQARSRTVWSEILAELERLAAQEFGLRLESKLPAPDIPEDGDGGRM